MLFWLFWKDGILVKVRRFRRKIPWLFFALPSNGMRVIMWLAMCPTVLNRNLFNHKHRNLTFETKKSTTNIQSCSEFFGAFLKFMFGWSLFQKPLPALRFFFFRKALMPWRRRVPWRYGIFLISKGSCWVEGKQMGWHPKRVDGDERCRKLRWCVLFLLCPS